MIHDSDILIVGGGLSGPTMALALARSGFRVTVIDSQSAAALDIAPFDGRGYAIAAGSRRMLQALGLWTAVKDHAQPMLDIKVTDGRAGEGASGWYLHFDHAEIDAGPMGHMVEDRHLRPALAAAMATEPLIRVMNEATVSSQTAGPGGVVVTLADGQALSAQLLIGADGRASGTATRAGLRRVGWGYGQTAVVCAVTHERPHHGVAHQFFMPGGPLAILPLTGNRSAIVWSEQDARAAEMMALDDTGFLAALRPAFGSHLGEISLIGVRGAYPLALSLAGRPVADRVALVGDAAHGVHPLAGQGLNAGFRDVAALAEVLGAARARGEDIGSAPVLSRYARWRGVDTAGLAATTDTVNRLFSNDNAALRLVRDAGMGLINRVPALRRRLIREAAGLTGDLPALMR